MLLRSFSNLQNQQLGMRADNTLTVSITLGGHNYPTAERLMTFFGQLARQLQFGPGVSLVAVSDSLPPTASHDDGRYDSIIVSGRPPSTGSSGGLVTHRLVSPDYFRALDIPIVQGEGFSEGQLTSSDHFLVLSQQLATRLFPGRSPVGERLRFDGQDGLLVRDPRRSGQRKNGGVEYYVLRRNQARTGIIMGFAATGLVLAVIGLYGVISF